ncbi:MAG: ATP-dependent Clp protease ATP-binding subunit ClpA, partial [Pseudomonadota bacterium]|nr:ATP-dependent Clp protease ATP-binding subunit ClpA [Pseudomonadota bacterium]
MLSKELEASLNIAFSVARSKRHEYITVEHLLLALLDNSSANTVLKACGADLQRLKKELTEFLEENTPVFNENTTAEVQPTLGFQRVLQ